MANEDSPAGEYYNEFATYYLNTQLINYFIDQN